MNNSSHKSKSQLQKDWEIFIKGNNDKCILLYKHYSPILIPFAFSQTQDILLSQEIVETVLLDCRIRLIPFQKDMDTYLKKAVLDKCVS